MSKKIIGSFLLLPTLALAGVHFPTQCRVSGIAYTRGVLSLFSQHTALPRLYAIKNTATHPLWLVHDVKNASASAGWSSYFLPNRWTVILVTQRRFDLHCQTPQSSGAMKSVACHSVTVACQFSHVTAKNPIGEGYFVVENTLFSHLKARIKARGFSIESLK